MSKFSPKTDARSGFTLAEILLAMLVFAIAITTILALLARSIETVDEIVLRDEAMRLSSAVERELSQIPFRRLYQSFAPHDSAVREMHAFQYRIDPTTRNPVANLGVDTFAVVPFAHPVGGNGWHQDVETPNPQEPFNVRDGRYFRVRLSVSPTNPIPPGDMPADSDDPNDLYESAALVLFAEFIPMGGPLAGAVPASPRGVYSYNFAVRR